MGSLAMLWPGRWELLIRSEHSKDPEVSHAQLGPDCRPSIFKCSVQHVDCRAKSAAADLTGLETLPELATYELYIKFQCALSQSVLLELAAQPTHKFQSRWLADTRFLGAAEAQHERL